MVNLKEYENDVNDYAKKSLNTLSLVEVSWSMPKMPYRILWLKF